MEDELAIILNVVSHNSNDCPRFIDAKSMTELRFRVLSAMVIKSS